MGMRACNLVDFEIYHAHYHRWQKKIYRRAYDRVVWADVKIAHPINNTAVVIGPADHPDGGKRERIEPDYSYKQQRYPGFHHSVIF